MTSNHWKDLIVWQKSNHITLEIYSISSSFPEDERYNLTSQLRRAAVSVTTNIVEGHDRSTTKDFLRFLYISRGSLEEVRYLLLLSRNLGYIDDVILTKIESNCSELSITLNRLIKSLKRK